MFKKSSAELKTLIINLIVVVLITVVLMVSYSSIADIPFMFGIVALGAGLLDIFFAVILFISRENNYGKAFLISGGILLLISGISCSGAAMFA